MASQLNINMTGGAEGVVSINGKTYRGQNIRVVNGNVWVDGSPTGRVDGDGSANIQVTVNGNVDSLKLDVGNVTVTGQVGDLTLGTGDAEVNGDVGQNVQVGCGDIRCGKVGGRVSTGCGNIRSKE